MADGALRSTSLEEILQGKTAIRQEYLPGHPAGSLSRWLDKRMEQKDFYDKALCRRIADIRDVMYKEAENIIEAYRRGEKDAALARRGSINDKASAIGILLMKVQDELKRRLG